MIIKIDPKNPSSHKLKKAASVLKNGGLVIFPTETLYGLAGKVSDEEALKKIYNIKERSLRKALPVMVSHISKIPEVAEEFPEKGRILANKYWPGPLTLILTSSPSISPLITGGRKSVGVRIPANRIALELLEITGEPLAVTSANISEKDNIFEINEIIRNFEKKVDAIIDGGPLHFCIPSTIVDITGNSPVILREGKIPSREIFQTLSQYGILP